MNGKPTVDRNTNRNLVKWSNSNGIDGATTVCVLVCAVLVYDNSPLSVRTWQILVLLHLEQGTRDERSTVATQTVFIDWFWHILFFFSLLRIGSRRYLVSSRQKRTTPHTRVNCAAKIAVQHKPDEKKISEFENWRCRKTIANCISNQFKFIKSTDLVLWFVQWIVFVCAEMDV